MAKDCFDMVEDVFTLINVPQIVSVIDGKIYQWLRPQNENKTDIVVSALFLLNEYIQRGVVNIRVHSPNQILNLPNKQEIDNTQPNQIEFARVSELVMPLLDGQHRSTFYTEINTPTQLFRQKDGSWVAAIKLNYYSIQDDYTNI